jgi:hypothetical protein
MAKNKMLRFTAALAVIFTAIMVSKKPTSPKVEKGD